MFRMSAWRRLSTEWPLLCMAWAIVCLIRLALWVLPFRILRHRLACVTMRTAPPGAPVTPVHLAWAVAVTSRIVPAASCLTQALATDVLLKRHGYRGTVHIGVQLNAQKRLAAHAWLEYDGVIIIGGRQYGQYTPLPPIISE